MFLISNDGAVWLQPELREMDEKSLEEELEALLSDKAGEAEYVESMQLQIMKLKVSLRLYLYILSQFIWASHFSLLL